jgi:type I restriction enzyme S subunit
MRYVFEAGLLNRSLCRVINTGVRNNGLLNLYERDFYAVKVAYPKIEEQQRIAAVLRTCDDELDHLTAQLDALKQQKKGLMQKLLTGEVRVPEAKEN